MKAALWFLVGLLPSPFLFAIALYRAGDLEAGQKRVQELAAAVERCRTATPRIPDLESRNTELASEQAILDRMLPKTLEPTAVAALLASAGHGHAVEATFEPIVSKDFYRELPWRAVLSGDLATCRRFVADIEKTAHLQEVVGFDFAPNAAGEDRCTVRGRAFGSTEPSFE